MESIYSFLEKVPFAEFIGRRDGIFRKNKAATDCFKDCVEKIGQHGFAGVQLPGELAVYGNLETVKQRGREVDQKKQLIAAEEQHIREWEEEVDRILRKRASQRRTIVIAVVVVAITIVVYIVSSK